MEGLEAYNSEAELNCIRLASSHFASPLSTFRGLKRLQMQQNAVSLSSEDLTTTISGLTRFNACR